MRPLTNVLRLLLPPLLVLGAAPVVHAEDGTLVARVTDDAGEPLAGAGVMCWSDEGSWSGLTDDEGRWQQTLPPGTYAAIVRAPGHVGREKHDLVVAAGSEVEVRWELEAGIPFRGRVLDGAGRPVADAHVTVVPGGSFEGWNEMFPGSNPLAREWSDDAGWFSVGGIPPGKIATVIVAADGFREARVGVRAEEGGVRPSPLEIRLVAGGCLTGRVVDPEGEGVADASVYVVPADQPQMRVNPTITAVADGEMIRALVTRTNPAGWFRIESLAAGGEYVALVEAPGFARWTESEPFTVAADGTCPELRITVRAGGTIAVRVLGEADAPIADAKMTLGSHLGAEERSTADADGLYRFHEVRPGRYALEVEAEAYLSRIEAVEAVSGEETLVEVRLDRGALLRGVLLDEAGRPAPGIRLGVDVETTDPVSGWTSTSSAMDETDDEGRFAIGPVAPGPYEIEVYSTRFDLAATPTVVAPATDLRVRGSWLGTATLRLMRPDGRPYEGTVWVWRPMAGHTGFAHGSPVEARDGRVTLDEIRTAPVHLELLTDDYAPVERDVSAPAGGEVDLGEVVLDPGHEIPGRVLAPDGTPVAEADVTLGRQRTEAGEGGRFVLEHVPAGHAVLELRADGFAKSWPAVEGGPDLGDLVLTLTRGEQVRVVVRDAEGEPKPGERVAIDAFVEGSWREAGVGRTDAEGAFRGRLPAGRVRFTHLDEDEKGNTLTGPVLAELDLVEGGERELVLKLPER